MVKEIYGTLINQNKYDTERTYQVIQSNFFNFYKLMYSQGWNLVKDKPCEINGLEGYEVIIERNI